MLIKVSEILKQQGMFSQDIKTRLKNKQISVNGDVVEDVELDCNIIKNINKDVRSFESIKNWNQSMQKCDNIILNEDTKILVGEPYNINKEWRNYIVNGKVVTSSLYRKDFKLKKSSEDILQDMIEFVEARCKEYQPHDVFVMDIALNGGEYYIIECGCINSVGFYAADITKLVKSVNEYVMEKHKLKKSGLKK